MGDSGEDAWPKRTGRNDSARMTSVRARFTVCDPQGLATSSTLPSCCRPFGFHSLTSTILKRCNLEF